MLPTRSRAEGRPDRLRVPLQRIDEKDGGRFREITWEQSLDEVAEAYRRDTAQQGSETVWPYYCAGTMGLAQRVATMAEPTTTPFAAAAMAARLT